MKRFLPFLALLFLVSCQPWDMTKENQEAIYDPIFPDILPTHATTVLGIFQWVDQNIEYWGDENRGMDDYWQSPGQTYNQKMGDSEDYAILMMYFIRREFGGWPSLVLGEHRYFYHKWILYDGKYYEALDGKDVTNDPLYRAEIVVSYEETMWRSIYEHRELEDQ